MATEQDLTNALDQLFTVIDTVVTELQNPPTNPDGSIPAAHIQALLDKVNAERDKVNTAITPGAPGQPGQPGTPPAANLAADPTVTRPNRGA